MKIKFMKKIILIFLSLFFIFLLNYDNTNASSGACSWHDGVNCTDSPNYDGKVICNDGWINSSVFFYDVDECKISPQICSYPIQPSCSLNEIEKQKENALASNRGINIRSGLTGSPFSETSKSKIENDYAIKYSSCQNSWNIYQSQMNTYNSCNELNKKNMQLDKEYAKFQSELKSQYICDEQYPGSIFNKEKFSCECSDGEELFSISAERKKRCVPSDFAKLMKEFLSTNTSSKQSTSTKNVFIPKINQTQLFPISTESSIKNNESIEKKITSTINKDKIEKTITDKPITASPDKKILEKNSMQQKQGFFVHFFDSTKKFLSKILDN